MIVSVELKLIVVIFCPLKEGEKTEKRKRRGKSSSFWQTCTSCYSNTQRTGAHLI